MSAGSSRWRLVSQTRRKYSAAAMPVILCTRWERPRRLTSPIRSIRRSPLRRSAGIRLEQPMHVDDEVAHVSVVHGSLRLGFPRRVGGGVVGKDAHDVELVEVLEFDVLKVDQLAAEDEMEELLRCGLARHRRCSRVGVTTQLSPPNDRGKTAGQRKATRPSRMSSLNA